ncbi:excinuclease ABC subunit UvrC [Methanofollis fontis]|uniref:UvrABC system protein C n=1 Tax=Methanofollis fontis TaxID=2052832 RepID=A0A483CLT6_9EURY|nr:excinuclease ABC subunit UvrC [Methanofollis fontis]TAJ43847.1 excinuclease ABC subunit C [Methanofollis fontis]
MIDYSVFPEAPGCYLYMDDAGRVIYVGKAKNLKRRVSSYFTRGGHDPKTERLVESIRSADYIVTGTETEALILENTLIKRHRPRYNIDLKDSRSYAYIHLTEGPYPRIGIARQARGKGEYFGPFVSAKERDYVLNVVKKTFGLRSCRRMPKRPCLRHHIGTCTAPCIGAIDEAGYRERIDRARSVLRGRTGDLIASLRADMQRASDDLEYERALELRDEIAAVEHLAARQRMVRRTDHDEDIIASMVKDGTVYLMLFAVIKGTLTDKQEYVFPESEGYFEEFLVQYYGERTPPKEVILAEAIDPALEAYLGERRGSRVTVTVPQRGDKKKLLDLAIKNIEITFFGDHLKLQALGRALHLPEPPNVIECFDISHLSGTAMVGSMVQFRGGRPDRQNYRRFRIRDVEGIDDFAAIAEVVRRRYTRLKEEGGEFPDLIIIDGGKGQLGAAMAELKRLDTRIPIISIAKREEEIFVPGFPHPIPIGRDEKASLFVQEIRNEAHRFAITYNRLLRKKAMIQ